MTTETYTYSVYDCDPSTSGDALDGYVDIEDVISECDWTYSEDDDEDPSSGPKHHDDGYDRGAYFDGIENAGPFATREEAIAFLLDSYKGADVHGVGLAIPEA